MVLYLHPLSVRALGEKRLTKFIDILVDSEFTFGDWGLGLNELGVDLRSFINKHENRFEAGQLF
jgi:hypothetical protein